MTMKKFFTKACILAIFCYSGYAIAQPNNPYIGYVYPAGGQTGTVFNVVLGGQNLRGANSVYFSNRGISANIIGYQGPSGPLNFLQAEELRRRIQEIRDKRAGKKVEDTRTETEKAIKLPDIPELRDLEKKTPRELQQIYEKYLNRENRPKPPVAEEVTIQVSMSPDVKPGDYEIRLRTPSGLTNPLIFQVGQFPEYCCSYHQYRYEKENVDRDTTILEAPVVINGRILPGKVNRFTLKLKKGQDITIFGYARKLIPYIADAVPGWFQAVLALYDENKKEVAYNDDTAFDPDPSIKFHVPEDGIYILEIRDSIYRGREDFVYRIYVMDNIETGIEENRSDFDEKISMLPDNIRNMPKYREIERKLQSAQSVPFPVLVSGCINYPGDIDRYNFYGRAGDTVVIEVFGRRLGWPIDSLIRLKTMDKVVAWNDDVNQDFEHGLLTHHADSYLMTKLPVSGNYTVEISDSQNHGGNQYKYFLRISNPLPDFQLIVCPSEINISENSASLIKVYAIKKDGWDGDIQLRLKNLPETFVLDGPTIPEGRSSIRLTLRTSSKYTDEIFFPVLEGRAIIDGKEVVRTARSAEEKMQAFAYIHPVPSETLLLAFSRSRLRQLKLDASNQSVLKIPAGGTATITCTAESWFRPTSSLSLTFEINNPPDGIKLKNVSFDGGKFLLTIEADKKLATYRDNLIIEVFDEITQVSGQKRKTFSGFLPAIAFEVVKNE